MRLSKADWDTIRLALHYATEWEASLSESWKSTRSNPDVLCKEEQVCQERIRRYHEVRNKIAVR